MVDIRLCQDEGLCASRKAHMVEKVVFVDGQPGCGKTLFSFLVSAYDRVEKLTYSTEIEQLCELYYLKRINFDAVVTMVRLITDKITYDTMMSREVNCRPSDLSAIFRDANTFRYIKRFFLKGDMAVPARIKAERPILSLTVHRLLCIAKPILEALNERAVFIEIVRHPLYMIIQQTLNNEILTNNVRDFDIYFERNQKEYPWYTAGWEEVFDSAKPVEKTIYYIKKIGEMTEKSKAELVAIYNAKIVTIPFEKFVIEPCQYLKQIEDAIESKITKKTLKMLKKQNVPRSKISDGIPLAIYKRCGWEPPQKGLNEKQELRMRRQFAIEQGAGSKAMQILDRISHEYEKKYLFLN
jgi:hypothetical protein